MAKRNIVRQHNNLINARYDLTVSEQRLIKILISSINKNDEDFKYYEFKALELAKLIGITDDGYYDAVRKTVNKLQTRILTAKIEIYNNGVVEEKEIDVNWVSISRYSHGNGTVEIGFHPILKPLLLDLKEKFTTYDIENILGLKSKHSIRLYELIKQFEKSDNKKREIKLSELRSLLNIENEYKEYKYLKKAVLLPSRNEISHKTDISFDIIERKLGRVVVSVIFNIRSNKEAKGDLIDLSKSDVSSTESIIIDLIDIGLSRKRIDSILNEFSFEKIRFYIDLTNRKKASGDLKTPSGFFIKALTENWTDSRNDEKVRKASLKTKKIDNEVAEKLANKEKENNIKLRIDQYLNSLNSMNLEQLKAEFIDLNKSNKTIIERFNKKGFESTLVLNNFRTYVFKKYIEASL